MRFARILLIGLGCLGLLFHSACGIGVKLCKVGFDCQPGQRCLEDRCQPPNADNNTPPIARIAADGRVKLNGRMRLDGTSSSDADLDYITFAWTFSSRPEGSVAVLENTKGRQAGFIADKSGTYVVKLTVKDALGAADETEHTVQVNGAPTANAGGDKLVVAGTPVTLDAGASRDPDEDPLTYQWRLLKVPDGSKANLQNPTQVISSFRPDIKGAYTVELAVSDAFDTSRQQLQIRAIDPEEVTPTLERLDPWQAPTRSIAKVSLFGNNFIQGAEVLFDGKAVANVTYVSLKQVTVELNLKDATVGGHQLRLRNPGGKTTPAQLFQVNEVPTPVITSVSPNRASTNQRVDVKIKGSGFVLGAVVYFGGSPTPAKYINQEELTTTFSLIGRAPGKYDVVVENAKSKRSKASPFEVTAQLSEPRITSYSLSPSGAYIDKTYKYLRLYASNINPDTQVLMSGKRYTGSVKITLTSETRGYAELAGFSSKGFSDGTKSFQLRNVSAGKNLTSASYRIRFIDNNKPSLYSPVYFYLKDKPNTSIGQTNKVYDYLRLRGRNLAGSIKVYIDKKEYTGKIQRMNSAEVRLPSFDTSPYKEGSYRVYIKQTASGKTYTTNEVTMRLQDGSIPRISRITTSDGTSNIFSNRKYTFFRIYGTNFYPGLEIIIDGVPLKGPIHIENEQTVYIYQVDTSNLQVGQHTMIIRNNINGKVFSSRLFTFQVQDGQTPVITRVYFSPSNLVYPGEVYTATITVNNVQPNAKVLVDGLEFKGNATVSQTSIVLSKFDTTGMNIGVHTIQVRNVINGKEFDSRPFQFSVRARPKPRLYSLVPNQFPNDKVSKATVNGNFFSTTTTFEINGKPVKATFNSNRSFLLDIDGTSLAQGRHTLIAKNPDGQTSNAINLDIIPDIGPTLWRVTPHELQVSPTSGGFGINLYGYRLVNGAQVLLDGKVIGTLAVTNPSFGRFTMPANTLTKAGVVKITVKNPDGKTSNPTEIWLYSGTSPEIFQVSPTYLRNSFNSLNLFGRGFGPGSSIQFNGKSYNTSYVVRVTATYTEQLRASIPVGDVQASPDPAVINVVRADGTKSKTLVIPKQSSGFYATSISPNYVVSGDQRTQTVYVRGTGFTSATELFLNGKKYPVTFLSSTRLQGTWQTPATLKAGSYNNWQIKDGNKASAPMPLFVSKGNLIQRLDPPFLGSKGGTITLNFNTSQPNGSITLFGKTHQVQFNPYRLIISESELQNQKAGLHTIQLKGSNGDTSNTVGFYLIK